MIERTVLGYESAAMRDLRRHCAIGLRVARGLVTGRWVPRWCRHAGNEASYFTGGGQGAEDGAAVGGESAAGGRCAHCHDP